jgi:hypothetical protein
VLLRLPHQFAVDLRSHHGDIIQQIDAPSAEAEGNLARYESPRLKGWLFQPSAGDEILVIPSKTKILPDNFSRVIGFDLQGISASMDASAGTWLKNTVPTIRTFEDKLATLIDHVFASWDNAFNYREENRGLDRKGLRKPQIGALHALSAHWTVSNSTATVVMPTGTGKTETMLSILISQQCRKVLVVVPTDALRTQLYYKFLTLGILKESEAAVVSQGALHPVVCNLKHIPTSVQEVDSLILNTQVCISTSAVFGRSSLEVQQRFAQHCSHLFIDEAHHVEAPTWSIFKKSFGNSRIVQFTATPFREDGKQLEGKMVRSRTLRAPNSLWAVP